jgi:hypothetical protein
MAKKYLELFLQGGLGNQLIQCAYASSLSRRANLPITVNPVLLSRTWALLRRISYRRRSYFVDLLLEARHGTAVQFLSLLLLKLPLSRASACFDDLCDAQTLQLIRKTQSSVFLFGYFQRRQAFDSSSRHFWSVLADCLLQQQLVVDPFPHGQIALHVRLGDYLLPENKRLFVHQPLEQLLQLAFSWSRRMGGSSLIHIITDDPATLRDQLSPEWSCKTTILEGGSAEADFLLLARHRHIVASNSTFSLCAGRLSAELWGFPKTTLRPTRWYVDESLNNAFDAELRACSFCFTAEELCLSEAT